MRGRCSDAARERARRKKIAAARTGRPHSKATRNKIAAQVALTHELRREVLGELRYHDGLDGALRELTDTAYLRSLPGPPA